VTGNIADSQLSANVPLLNGTNSFTGTNTLAGVTMATNVNNIVNGTFVGNLTGNVTGNLSGNAATATSATSATTAGSATTAMTANNFSGSLSGDVTGTQSATVVSTVGGLTAANVGSGVNAANAATSLNTANTIVARDASGNFSAGSVTLENNLYLPGPTATVYSGGSSFLRSDDNDNFFAGPGAGNLTTSGGRNTANGYQALQANTSGSANTVSGFEALNDNTSGSGNTAIGYQAFQANTSGSENTAIGLDALLNNTTGNYNIALGDHAGFNIGFNTASGSNNIDIGNMGVATDTNIIRIGDSQTQTFLAGVINGNGGGLTNLNASQISSGIISLAQLPAAIVTSGEASVTLGNITANSLTLPATTLTVYSGNAPVLHADGNGNFFAGPDAGASTTTGSDNTANGNDALVSNTSGSENTANGSGALGNLYAGSYNTANGSGALGNAGGSDNTADGFDALGNNTSGSYNTANGVMALYGYSSNPFAIVSASSNTADGFDALYSNLTGNNNTANGVMALYNNTSGANNIALGYQAGYNITGNNNIDIGNAGVVGESGIIRIGNQQTTAFIAGTTLFADANNNFFAGPNAGVPGTSGAGNTALGYQALTYGTSGNGNTAIGYQALADAYDGSFGIYYEGHYDGFDVSCSSDQNTAVGYQALASNLGGYQNTATGYQSLYSNGHFFWDDYPNGQLLYGLIVGYQNTADGYQALYNNVVGYQNTANGYQALYNNNYTFSIDYDPFGGEYYAAYTIGAQNTADGYQSLYQEQTGNNNVALGYQAGYNFTSGESYNIDIGNAGVQGDNSTIRIGSGQTQTFIAGVINGSSGSFLAGGNSQSTNTGAFVWSDSTGTLTKSTNNNSVTMRASGGYRFFTGTNQTAGAQLKPNATAWSTLSDRNAKKNFAPVNSEAILDKLAQIPIQQWNYKWEKGSDTPNIGPMAQDFKGAFYPGRDDKSITTLEFDGVELAAIQGLNQKINERNAEIRALKQQNDSLAERLNQLEATVQALAEKK